MKQLLFLFVTLLPLTLHAIEVSQEEAVATAKAVMTERVEGFMGVVKQVKAVYYDGRKAYYMVQFDNGWTLISADDHSDPLIGYSPDGVFPSAWEMPDNMRGMMDLYGENVVRNALTEAQLPCKQRPAQVRRYASTDKVEPLIKVNWNQSGNYQKYCPKTNAGTAVVGCVAVGMAQAMSVAKWPDRPVGEYGYSHNTYGSIYVNYDAEPAYNWTAILSGANGYDDVARLLYHCGVSVRMDYGVDGSGTQTSYIASALQRNFKYPQSVKYYSRSNFSDDDWMDLVLTELQAGRAVAYSGSDPKKHYGHCFNLDGFDGSSAFHVNWGWGGVGNAYFQLNGLKDAKMDMNYTDGQGIIIGIRPPSDKPSNIYLSSTKVAASQPAGMVVGTVVVESEAENPVYSFVLKGKYSARQHKYLEAPFQIIDGLLVTTKELKEGTEQVTITATNTKNNGSVERTFNIQVVTAADGVTLPQTNAKVMDEEIYLLNGMRMDAATKGLRIIRQRMSDGSYRTVKRMH